MRKARKLMLACAYASCLTMLATGALAQEYPTKVVRYMVGDGAGSGNDIFGRIMAQELGRLWGQQVIVDNRPGAAQRIAAEIAAKAPADGYTILHMSATLCANVSLYKDLPYDLINDFAPVTLLAMTPAVVVVHPSFPAKSVKELIQLAKSKPGAINYASAGTGSRSFVDAALFVSMAGINMVHVPFKSGGQAAGAVVAGEIPVYLPPVIAAISHINAGRLRALAVSSEARLPLLDIPTVSEAGVPGYASSGWYGLIVPAKTPKNTIEAIHRGVTTVLSKADIKQKVNELGTIPVANRPDQFGRFIKEDIALQAKVFKAAGITAQ